MSEEQLLQGAFLEHLDTRVDAMEQRLNECVQKVGATHDAVIMLRAHIDAVEAERQARMRWLRELGDFLVRIKDVRVIQWIVAGALALLLHRYVPGLIKLILQLPGPP